MKQSIWLVGIIAPTALVAALGVAGHAVAENAEAEYCREYQREVTIDNKVTTAYGTACLQPDGSWQIVSDNAAEVVAAPAPVKVITKVVERPVVVEKVVVKQEPRHWQNPPHVKRARWHHGHNLGFQLVLR